MSGSETAIDIQIQADGDARISVITKVPIQGENSTAGFKKAAKEFEVGGIKGNVLDPFRQAVSSAGNVTDRPMSIVEESIARNASLNGGVGRFTTSFTWRNFAMVIGNGTYIKVGDTFNATHGTWLPALTTNQTLIIRAPQGYYVRSAPIGHQEQVLQWVGPKSFEPRSLNVTYAYSGVLDTPTSTPTSTQQQSPLPPTGSVPLFTLAVGAVVLVAIGSLGVFAFSRSGTVLTRVIPDGGVGTKEVDDSNPPLHDPDPDPDPDSNPISGTGSDLDTEHSDENEDEGDSIDLDLLSDEERVERLLRRNDGRMKQASIVRETDWSDAKVSQLLSAMDEAGRIDKLRIGRENLISLSDYDADGSGSSSDSDQI